MIQEKTCNRCKRTKPLSAFSAGNNYKNSIKPICKECINKYSRQYHRTDAGLFTQIYAGQKQSSKHRGHPLPNYTKHELSAWITSQSNFQELWSNWVESGYKKELKPSCDRKDNYLPYTLDNLQLITWKQNETNGHTDHKNGILQVTQKAVLGTNIVNGNKLIFHSMKEAERQTGICYTGISRCCSGHKSYSHAGGYKWKINNI